MSRLPRASIEVWTDGKAPRVVSPAEQPQRAPGGAYAGRERLVAPLGDADRRVRRRRPRKPPPRA